MFVICRLLDSRSSSINLKAEYNVRSCNILRIKRAHCCTDLYMFVFISKIFKFLAKINQILRTAIISEFKNKEYHEANPSLW